MPNLVTQKEYSTLIGTNQQFITRLINDGNLAPAVVLRGGKRMLDKGLADKLMLDTLDPSSKRSGGPGGGSRKNNVEAGATLDVDNLTYSQARTRNESYKAALKELEFKTKSGGLVPAEDVWDAAFRKARTLRDALMAIPDRIGPILAAETNQGRAIEMIGDEIRAVLKKLNQGRIC